MLYFVATPIGNLGDISLRAVEILKSVDVIACEDTRHSKILLNNYGIFNKTIAYHKFNEQNSADGIVDLLKKGKNVAVISDAGMPVISDPGNILAKKLHDTNLPYTVVPGANAGLTALLLSGFDASKFAFWGFLSEKNKELKNQLKEISAFYGSSIIYSSKYNINKDLLSLHLTLGKARVAIVSEITKIHEKVEIVTLPAQIGQPKGEYVLVVENIKPTAANMTDEQILCELNVLMRNIPKSEAIRQIKEKYNLTKSYVYNLYENSKK